MKYTVITVMSLVASLNSFSCDICGGIGSNVSAGMLLNERFHVIGLRSVNRMSTSYLHGVRHSGEYIFSQEVYTRIQLGQRFQLIGALPFQTALQKRDLGKDVFSGLADPYAYVNAILIHRKDSLGATRSFLSLGGGLKVPAGKYASTADGFQNLYPGSGACDVLASINIVRRLGGRVSSLSEASFTYRTTNPVGFRFGNVITASTQLTHYKSHRGNRLLYAAGAYLEHFGKSVSRAKDLGSNDNSGYTSGLRFNATYLTQRWLLSSQLNIPIFQKLNDGNVKSRGVIQLGIHYLIKSNSK